MSHPFRVLLVMTHNKSHPHFFPPASWSLFWSTCWLSGVNMLNGTSKGGGGFWWGDRKAVLLAFNGRLTQWVGLSLLSRVAASPQLRCCEWHGSSVIGLVAISSWSVSFLQFLLFEHKVIFRVHLPEGHLESACVANLTEEVWDSSAGAE